MFGIGEFASYGRVSVRMLRHYDAIGLLRPAHVDPATGYRHYRAEQLADLNRIVALKDLGFTLDQVRTMIDERVTVEELRGMLRLRQVELAERIQADQARLREVEARLRLAGGPAPGIEAQVKSIPAVRLAELTGIAGSYGPADIGPVIRPLYAALIHRLDVLGVPVVGPAVAYYEDADDGVIVHAGLPVDVPTAGDLAVTELPPVATAATIVHKGSMDAVMASYGALARWIDANGFRSTGYPRELYVQPDMAHGDSWVVELQEPVETGG